MGKRVKIQTDLTAEELHERYRQAQDAVERTHWHMLWLAKEGKTPQVIAELLGYTARWVRTVLRRWNEQGAAGIRDRRHAIDGSRPLLSPELQQELAAALQAPPAAGCGVGRKWPAGCSSVSARRWLLNGAGTICAACATARGCLVRSMARLTKQHSRLLRKLPEQVASVQQAYPQARVEVWAMDEHRIGLKPMVRRVWALTGAAVTAQVAQRYEWMYVYAFVQPQSGQTCWLLLPTVNVEVFSRALAAFAAEVGAGPDKPIVLLLDRAGWHSSAHLTLPEGMHLVFLPPYSPEVQQLSDFGRSPMSHWPIGFSPRWTS